MSVLIYDTFIINSSTNYPETRNHVVVSSTCPEEQQSLQHRYVANYAFITFCVLGSDQITSSPSFQYGV